MLSQSLELSVGDFDAYLPERANSNVYSRPRLEFKQRALGWARHVLERLEAIGLHLEAHGSDEHPSVRNNHRVDCQWVFFWRPQEQREFLEDILDQRAGLAQSLYDSSSHCRHAFLALRLDSQTIEVVAQVHPEAWVDFESFQARLSQPSPTPVLEILQALPEQFRVGVSDQQAQPIDTLSIEGLQRLVEQAREQKIAFWVGWSVEKDVAIEHAQILDEQLEDALVALGSVYRLLVWSESDDPAGLKDTLEQMRADLAEAAARRKQMDRQTEEQNARARQQQTEKSRERTKERVEYDSSREKLSLANLFKSSPEQASPRPEGRRPEPRASKAAPSTATPPAAMPHGEPRPAQRKTQEAVHSQPKVSRPRRPQPPPPTYVVGGAVEKGAQVRVLSGPFEGKVGILNELDGRGGARVLLGLLSTRVLVEQLETVVEAKDRPAIQSSHRRDGMLGRSGK